MRAVLLPQRHFRAGQGFSEGHLQLGGELCQQTQSRAQRFQKSCPVATQPLLWQSEHVAGEFRDDSGECDEWLIDLLLRKLATGEQAASLPDATAETVRENRLADAGVARHDDDAGVSGAGAAIGELQALKCRRTTVEPVWQRQAIWRVRRTQMELRVRHPIGESPKHAIEVVHETPHAAVPVLW